jgi:hypothetical protein
MHVDKETSVAALESQFCSPIRIEANVLSHGHLHTPILDSVVLGWAEDQSMNEVVVSMHE